MLNGLAETALDANACTTRFAVVYGKVKMFVPIPLILETAKSFVFANVPTEAITTGFCNWKFSTNCAGASLFFLILILAEKSGLYVSAVKNELNASTKIP